MAVREQRQRLVPSPRRLFAPVDIASLVFFRLVFAASILTEIIKHLGGGWLKAYYIDPPVHFTFFGFGWVRPVPDGWLYVVFWLIGAFAVLMFFGAFYRISAIMVFVGWTYTFLLDQATYRNHYYLLALIALLMIFLPAHRALSIDAWIRPKLRSDTAPAWSLWLLRAQLGVVYLFAGVAKVNPDWLSGEPIRAIFAEREHGASIDLLFANPWVVYAFVWAGMLLDLLVVPGLLWRRTRILAFLAAGGFHLTNALVLVKVGVFPWFMLLATMLYFHPSWPRLGGLWKSRSKLPKPPRSQPSEITSPARLQPGQKVTLGLLSIYMTIQILLPLRQHLYPGPTAWTHQGHRWSWRVKLNHKVPVKISFTTINPDTGVASEIPVARMLPPWQRWVIATKPDMILQFAHYCYARQKAEGYDYEIRANITVSLNGREPQLLIDPNVDLAKVERNLWPAKWILPLDASSP